MTLLERSYWEQLTDGHHGPAPERVWGVAFRIAADKVDEVKEYLDIREVGGYTIHYTTFYPASDGSGSGTPPPPSIQTLVYIGTPDNPQFTGPLDPDDIATTIFASTGPSGRNRDYLWGLERALGELGPESGDEHVTDLSNRVRALAAASQQEERDEEDGSPTKPIMSSLPPVSHDFKKVSSIDEQEETEKSR